MGNMLGKDILSYLFLSFVILCFVLNSCIRILRPFRQRALYMSTKIRPTFASTIIFATYMSAQGGRDAVQS